MPQPLKDMDSDFLLYLIDSFLSGFSGIVACYFWLSAIFSNKR